MQALHQIQALNGFAATTPNGAALQQATTSLVPNGHTVVTPCTSTVSGSSTVSGQQGQNPYQGAGLSSTTTATAQPNSAAAQATLNLMALQQLLAASNGAQQTTQLTLANGAQGKSK